MDKVRWFVFKLVFGLMAFLININMRIDQEQMFESFHNILVSADRARTREKSKEILKEYQHGR